ncbi:hypothetical protein [Actinoallomurus rhizosphaericola]|uniref:hypothetical protein n=1 Tax=Actinoallomurus rhizosphaericola TaxID=2952536 RepID=UPI0020926DE2|nr:hypothetical protein [Actinoallomurus rhizosphaericola]MCO5999439.1 hypothetical protein [Actinoallomurus rhizosphaericola]
MLERLASAGWQAAHDSTFDGKINFMTGDFDWNLCAAADYDDVVRKMDDDLSQGSPTAIALWLPDGTGINLLFHDDRSSLTIEPGANRRELPGAPEVTDLAWYFTRTVPCLADLGLDGLTAIDGYE